MQNSQITPSLKPQTAPQRVGILLSEAFSNHCLANTVEPLRAANTQSGRRLYDWAFLTLDGGPVASSSGLPVVPQGRLSDHRGDLLMLLPSYGHLTLATPAMLAGLRAAAGRYDTLVGLDMGAWLMAAAGLLDGRCATIHWDEADAFAERFPAVDVRAARYLIDGDRVTCGGATAAFDLILHLIQTRHGLPLRLEVAALFLHGERDPGTPLPRQTGGPGARVDAATALMRRNVEAPLPIARIARMVGLGQRTLEMHCRAHLGAPPRAIYRQIRLSAARRLLESTDLPVIEIADRCGYLNASALTRAFRQVHGVTPSALRKAQDAPPPREPWQPGPIRHMKCGGPP